MQVNWACSASVSKLTAHACIRSHSMRTTVSFPHPNALATIWTSNRYPSHLSLMACHSKKMRVIRIMPRVHRYWSAWCSRHSFQVVQVAFRKYTLLHDVTHCRHDAYTKLSHMLPCAACLIFNAQRTGSTLAFVGGATSSHVPAALSEYSSSSIASHQLW
jgi:hypothetical protein